MESNHVIPRYQRGAVTVWRVLYVWSQERSNLFLPGFDRPLHHQSFRTVHLLENLASEGIRDSLTGEGTLAPRNEQTEPAVGIEPTPSRVLAERPSFRTSPAYSLRTHRNSGLPEEDSNPHSRCNKPTSCHWTIWHRSSQHSTVASPARLERATPAVGRRCSRPLSYGERVSAAGVEPAISGFVDRRLLHSTTSTSCCCVVRALGLEPSLFRGKSPVPHQSGVTREVGREGIEPPMSEDRWFTARCAAMARPTHVGPM